MGFITSIRSFCIWSSGREPRDSGPHSFCNISLMLKMAPLLISDDCRSSSTLKAATLERLSAGCLSASGYKGKMLIVEREEMLEWA